MKDRTDKGLISETRALYDQLVSRVRRDREAARRRGPVAKALLAACFIMGLLAAVTLAYGYITFPDAPIRKTSSGYVSKQGAARTREDYERFKLWEKLVVGSFGLAFLTGCGAVAAEKTSQRRRGGD